MRSLKLASCEPEVIDGSELLRITSVDVYGLGTQEGVIWTG
jgi:hypothetical protein